MIRSSRTPTFILIALLVVILVLTYNYWSLSEKNQALRNSLYKVDEKRNVIEKENHINSGRVKYFEDRADALQKSNKEKEDELAKVKSELEDSKKEVARLLWEDGDKKNKLDKCNEDMKTQISLLQGKHQEELELLKINNTNLNGQITKLLDTIAQDKVKLTIDGEQKKQICTNESNAALEEFKVKLFSAAKTQFDEQTLAKIQALVKPVEVVDRIIKNEGMALMQATINKTSDATKEIVEPNNANLLHDQIQAERETDGVIKERIDAKHDAEKSNDIKPQLDAPNNNDVDRNIAKRETEDNAKPQAEEDIKQQLDAPNNKGEDRNIAKREAENDKAQVVAPKAEEVKLDKQIILPEVAAAAEASPSSSQLLKPSEDEAEVKQENKTP